MTQEVVEWLLLLFAVLLAAGGLGLQLRLKKAPYLLCAFSAVMSTLSWIFWVYYTSRTARTGIIFGAINLPFGADACWMISAFFYILATFAGVTGTGFLVYFFVYHRAESRWGTVLRSVLSLAAALIMFVLAPGLVKI